MGVGTISLADVWMIHGYLGAGKTTLARELAGRLRLVRFSCDEWMTVLYGDDPPEERFWEYYERVQGLCDRVWTDVLTGGVGVVLDFGFWGKEFREERVRMVAALGGRVRWVKVVCDEALALERVLERNSDLGGSLLVTENTFHVLKPRFEEMRDEEVEFVFDSGAKTVGAFLNRIGV